MKALSGAAKAYLACTVMAASIVLGGSLWGWHPEHMFRGAFYLLGAVLASQLKVKLPGAGGTLSMNFLFVLIGAIETDLAGTLWLAAVGITSQMLSHARGRPKAARMLFELSSAILSAAYAWSAFHSPWLAALDRSLPIRLFFATLAYFFTSSFSVSVMIGLTENRNPTEVWRQSFLWTAPEHLVGAALAALFHVANVYVGWQMAVLTVPVAYLVYRSYRLYLHRLEEERKHVQDLAEMHWRTIEALALAIDAKDNTTHDHLKRVRVYAVEIARELGLDEAQQKALEIASVLHDIGKLAVPEHILSKPTRLTPSEFETMKAHPAVGAAILERVRFPYPVVPIVRAHHEKWDGSGYPYGLSGESIPIGARILAAVDCLDALASVRQYRRALPLDVAMQKVASESGRGFDPQVVEILRRRYLELESRARSAPASAPRAVLDPRCVAGGAPDAGYETGEENAGGDGLMREQPHPVMEAAMREFQTLLDVTRQAGEKLTHTEVFTLAAGLLECLIPHDSMALYVCRNRMLVPEYVAGEESHLLSSLRIPLGRGISGWVVDKRKAVINGDPAVESHYLAKPWSTCSLQAALSVPLDGPNGTLGALALYDRTPEHFRRDDLRLLLSLSGLIGNIVHQAARWGGDGLLREESLPPQRAFHLHLERELGRARRTNTPLAVLALKLAGLSELREQQGEVVEKQVVQAALNELRNGCRAYDYACRLEENLLAMVIPGVAQPGVSNRLPELQALVLQAATLVCPEAAISVRSAAVVFPEDGQSAEELLGGVERRLRAAQPSGRFPATDVADGLNIVTHMVQ